MTRVRIEPRSGHQGRCKNDAFTLSATLPKASILIPTITEIFPMFYQEGSQLSSRCKCTMTLFIKDTTRMAFW